MEDLQAAFPILFDEDYSNDILKLWFPKQKGKMDQILQNILFEEIDYKYEKPNEKKGLLFRLKDGLTIEEINQKLDDLEANVKPWLEKVKGMIAGTKKRSPKNGTLSYRPNQKPQPSSTNTNYTAVFKKPGPTKSKVFANSDDEEDDRVENRAYQFNAVQRKAPIDIMENNNVVDTVAKETSSKLQQNKEIKSFAKTYVVTGDINLVELYDEAIIEAEEVSKLVNIEAAGNSKVADTSKDKNVPTTFIPGTLQPKQARHEHVLNPSHYFNNDSAYTDEEEDNDDDPPIATKTSTPSPVGDAVSENQKNNESGDISSNQTNKENGQQNVAEPQQSSSSIPNETQAPAVEPQAPKRFQFGTIDNKFHYSTEISKAKKDADRIQREKATGTYFKKANQYQHPPPMHRTSKTSPPTNNDVGHTLPAYLSSAAGPSRVQKRTPDPGVQAADKRSPNKYSQSPIEAPKIRRDPDRPYNYGSSSNNQKPIRRTPPVLHRTLPPPLREPVKPQPMKPHPVKAYGGFARPYNLPPKQIPVAPEPLPSIIQDLNQLYDNSSTPIESNRTQPLREPVEPQPKPPPKKYGGFAPRYNLPRHVPDVAALEAIPNEREDPVAIRREVMNHFDNHQQNLPHHSPAPPLPPHRNSHLHHPAEHTYHNDLNQIPENFHQHDATHQPPRNRNISQNSQSINGQAVQHGNGTHPPPVHSNANNYNGYNDNRQHFADDYTHPYQSHNNFVDDHHDAYQHQPRYTPHITLENWEGEAEVHHQNRSNHPSRVEQPPPLPEHGQNYYNNYNQPQHHQQPQYLQNGLNDFAVPNHREGFRSIDFEQHQQNYYPFQENVYLNNPQDFDPSAIPNGQQRINPASLTQSHTTPQNEVSRIINIIQEMVDVERRCDVRHISRVLSAAGIADHPSNIRGLNISTWIEFVNIYFRDVYEYYETAQGNFISYPRQS
uniref:Uncharacterized protein n=1 Tax=Panagrolaimus davidi TaxID=227884 RepID=A0A914Q347_9BILA